TALSYRADTYRPPGSYLIEWTASDGRAAPPRCYDPHRIRSESQFTFTGNNMKNRYLAALAACGLAPALALSQTLPLHTTSGGDLGVEVYGYAYDTDRNGTSDVALTGRKLGLTGSFTKALEQGWFWGMDGRYASGGTTFTSSTIGSNSGSTETLLDLRLLAGKDVVAGSHVLAPYTGLGYRAVHSQLTGYTTLGYISPTRKTTQFYIPIGLTYRTAASPTARIATTFEADYLLNGTQQTRYTEIAGYISDLNVSQKRGYGLRLNVAYETARWSAGVFFQFWNIAESEIGTYADTSTVYTATEAANITRISGIQVKYRFD
ncbi:MAG: hypothetical protein ACK4J1_03105, partial [Hylemonella sp.]